MKLLFIINLSLLCHNFCYASLFRSPYFSLSTNPTTIQPRNYEEIFSLVANLSEGLDIRFVNATLLAQSVQTGIYDGITDEELNSLASETAAYMSTDHPDYGKLAARLAISYLHKHTTKTFSETIYNLYTNVQQKTGMNTTNLAPYLYDTVMKYADIINAEIHPERDFEFDYFGVKTLEK